MTSRDAQASYYDLELPDGTRTEVWSVLRAVLSPEESLGYVKGCILTRIMRDGHKDVDRQREAEKVAVEAGMLREAMEAYLATPRAIAVTVSCDDPAARIAELERERDGWRQTAERAQPDLDAMRKTLEAERQAAVATAEELERVRRKLAQVEEWRGTWRDSCNNARKGAEELHRELADLRERYRPRRQSEEPAPTGQMVLRWDPSGSFWRAWTEEGLVLGSLWTHQPPAPEVE